LFTLTDTGSGQVLVAGTWTADVVYYLIRNHRAGQPPSFQVRLVLQRGQLVSSPTLTNVFVDAQDNQYQITSAFTTTLDDNYVASVVPLCAHGRPRYVPRCFL
jgi:hypothetical protein